MIFFSTLLTVFLVALIPLVLYALTKCGRNFNVWKWLKATRSRLYLGMFLMVLLTALIVYSPDASEILTLLGFNAARPAPLGLAIGGLLVAGIRGKDKSSDKREEKT